MTQARESKWKTIFSIIAVFTFGCSSPDLGQINLKTTNALQLVWQDEFDGITLDLKKWTPEQSCWGGGNEERQCYTARPENVRVEDGYLKLKAQEEAWVGPLMPVEKRIKENGVKNQPYTSGKIRTRGKASWQFGRFEARIKLPQGQGTWPAFWMLPDTDHYGSWPASGEIDIMEAVNLNAQCNECGSEKTENRIFNALHFGDEWPNNSHEAKHTILPPSKDGFNVFGMTWDKDKIVWDVDGRIIFIMDKTKWQTERTLEQSEAAPFDQPFYLNLNLAVGGKLSEQRNELNVDPTSFPAELIVDWVRVYQ